MNIETRNHTDQQLSRKETENALGASSNVNEPAASARSEQAGQFLAWWKEYRKKMQSVLRSSPMKVQVRA